MAHVRQNGNEWLAAFASNGRLGIWNLTNMECSTLTSVIPALENASASATVDSSRRERAGGETIIPLIRDLSINELGMALIEVTILQDATNDLSAIFVFINSIRCWLRVDSDLYEPCPVF